VIIITLEEELSGSANSYGYTMVGLTAIVVQDGIPKGRIKNLSRYPFFAKRALKKRFGRPITWNGLVGTVDVVPIA